MKVLVDTNVVLDVLLDRKPFSSMAAKIFALAEKSAFQGILCATTMTTTEYLLTESVPQAEARTMIWKLLTLFEIAPVNRAIIERALRSPIKDFEDAVLDEAGHASGAQAIVTRNAKDFRQARLKIFDPAQFLAQVCG